MFLSLSFDVSADNLCKNLDTDQDRQNIRPLDANCFTLMAFLNTFFFINFEERSEDDKKKHDETLSSVQRVIKHS